MVKSLTGKTISQTCACTLKFIKFLAVVIAMGVLAATWVVPAMANDPGQALKSGLGPKDSVLLSEPEGKILFALNSKKKRVPASTLKVATALAAIAHLGLDHRFSTHFYINSDKDLIIKGFGDPLLVSESVAAIANHLKIRLEKSGVDRIRHIILDDSYFKRPIRIPGTATATRQPYNAPNGALCVNFNTVNFKTENGRIVSAEPQTPMLPIALSQIRAEKQAAGRILLSDHRGDTLQYAGELFENFLNRAGVKTSGSIREGTVEAEADARLVYQYDSQLQLAAIIEGLLKYSNNYVANQLLLAIGASVHGPPATLEKGVRVLSAYCREELGIEELQIVEGSGISRQNRISAETFARILDAFEPYYDLLPHQQNIYYKTGTLDGIRTRAGYINCQQKGLYRFVIFLNTPGKETGPVLDRLHTLVP